MINSHLLKYVKSSLFSLKSYIKITTKSPYKSNMLTKLPPTVLDPFNKMDIATKLKKKQAMPTHFLKIPTEYDQLICLKGLESRTSAIIKTYSNNTYY